MIGNSKGEMLSAFAGSYVIFDLETTGVSSRHDSIIEISAVKVVDGQVTDEFSELVNPERTIPYAASMVNHITDDMVKEARILGQVLPDFDAFIGDAILAGHNIHSFDMKFLHRDYEHIFGKTIANDYVDTYLIARKILPGIHHYKLVDLAARYHIGTDGAHRALNDCRMNQKVYEFLAKEGNDQKGAVRDVKTCMRCGMPMVKRNGRFGQFWGCCGYPACRYTENI